MNQLMQGTIPLTARLEPWMQRLVADRTECQELIRQHGSPVNIHEFSALARNADELRTVAFGHGIDFRVYLARKANKTIGAIDAAVAADCGVDVASLHELKQVLERGVAPEQIIVTAAVKSRELLALALEHAVVVSMDNHDEAETLLEIAGALGVRAKVALRLASAHPSIPATRFGLRADRWLTFLEGAERSSRLDIAGIHFHLNGYSAEQRSRLLLESVALTDTLVELGYQPSFIDMGGGIPMSYLEHAEEWEAFWAALAQQQAGSEEITWKSDALGSLDGAPSGAVYPYYQKLIRGPWLDAVLSARPDGAPSSIADMLVKRKLQLRCEPGRSLLDGCGMTLASVAFAKERSDGIPLLGLHMNRTQCRSTSADFLLDPILIHAADPPRKREPFSGFLVGAYCIEEELLLRRRFDFPFGAAPQDLVVFPNTAGYLMHIVESASHQLPLAVNVVRAGGGWKRDEIHEQALPA